MSSSTARQSLAPEDTPVHVAEVREQIEHAPADQTSKFSRRYVLLILGLTAVWGVLMNQFGSSPIYWVMGPYSAVVCVTLLVARGHALRARLRPTAKNVALGVGMGALMTVCTYPAFDLARSLFPSLVSNVADLYRQSQNERLSVALVAVLVILAAEELLWRGAWYEAWCARIGPLKASALCVLSYALTQLCSGSFIVCLLAVVCGTVWTAMRHYSGSLVPSLIAHAIWTPTVILLIPVTWQ